MVTEDKFDFNNCIKELKSSTMFYMSLGSKELFHSNFLHWLSIIDMDYFLKVIRSLSGVTNSFWWEDPKKYKIDVRREDKNFDLSIWVLDNCKDKKNEKEEKWIPVLVLENKMKSLPYREQLEKYVDKAFNIWKTGDNKVNVKSEIDVLKKNPNSNWNTNYGITFILLSLLKPTNIKELANPIIKSVTYGKRPNVKSTPSVSFKWVCKDYKDLFNAINDNTINSNSPQQTISFLDLIKDYSKFINNLYDIANNDWKIDESAEYIKTVCPQKMDINSTEYQRIVTLEELRIADIRDKIINDQLLHLVLGRLTNFGAKILQKGDFNAKGKRGSFLCRTNFFHNVGLFEVIFMIKERDTGKKNAEPFFITIQVQGDTYMHGISGVNVVKTENNTNVIGEFWNDENNRTWKNDLDFFFDFRDENVKNNNPRKDHFPQKLIENLKEHGKNYKYDTNFIYQCSIIPEGMSIKDVLDCIGKEVKIICDKLRNKVFQTMSVPLSPTSPT